MRHIAAMGHIIKTRQDEYKPANLSSSTMLTKTGFCAYYIHSMLHA